MTKVREKVKEFDERFEFPAIGREVKAGGKYPSKAWVRAWLIQALADQQVSFEKEIDKWIETHSYAFFVDARHDEKRTAREWKKYLKAELKDQLLEELDK